MSSNVKGEPPPAVAICASMVPVLLFWQDKVVSAVANVGALAVATVEVAVPILPQASLTETVYGPGTKFSNTDEFWKALVTGEGAINAY